MSEQAVQPLTRRMLVCGSPAPQRIMVCPQRVQPPRREVVVQRPVIRQRVVPKYIRIKHEPARAPEPMPERPRIVIRDRRPRAAPPPAPPPVFIMAPPQCCAPKCNQALPLAQAHTRKKSERRPRSSSDHNIFGRISQLDDESLYHAATLAAAALAAPDDAAPAEDVIEVVVPKDACPGDTLDVRLPAEAGGGSVCVAIPHGARPGETIELAMSDLRK